MTMTRTKDTAAEVLARPHIRRRWWPRIGVAAILAILVILVPGAPVAGV